jgi:hypothetical protein
LYFSVRLVGVGITSSNAFDEVWSALGSVIWSFFAEIVQLVFVAHVVLRVCDRQLKPVRSFELIIIETLRSFAAILFRIPLLVLPAVYEWLRLLPVPYLVLLDRRYRAGERDALTEARCLFAGHRWLILSLLGLRSVLWLAEAMLFENGQGEPLMSLQHIWSSAFLSILNIGIDVVCLRSYQRILRESA